MHGPDISGGREDIKSEAFYLGGNIIYNNDFFFVCNATNRMCVPKNSLFHAGHTTATVCQEEEESVVPMTRPARRSDSGPI